MVLLEEDMGFDLIDRAGLILAYAHQLVQADPDRKLLSTDGPDFAFFIVKLLHRLPGTFNISPRPVDEVEVQILRHPIC